jgi:molybdopterin/thiamine biosynthesis adenylyltransferase
MEGSARVVVIGAGGNIGSHLVPHLARTPEIGSLTLVDRDAYEARNLANQDMPPRAARRNKAAVQAGRARRLNPRLRVRAVAADVETLPLGALRGDLLLACVDSRRARQRVNQAAWRLGIPWVDAGVLGEGLLARVTGYVPAPDQPCLE